MDKRLYSNKETLIEVIKGKNGIYTNKKHRNKKFIFTNNFKYVNGKILLYYMNIIIILMIFNLSINSLPYIELTIPGPRISRVFYKNEGNVYNEYCPTETTIPTNIYINNKPQETSVYEYYLEKPENIIKLEYDITSLNLICYFHLCSNITKVDFTNFIGIPIKYAMSSLFNGCTSLKSVNFANIDTSNVISMTNMFINCTSLESIDLSNFVTTSLTHMNLIFYNCISLKSINLSNFDVQNVITISRMFDSCEQLISMDLSNLKAPQLTDMSNMFNNCKKLASINLSNFECPNVKNMESMFKNCESLVSIDLFRNPAKNLIHLSYLFLNCYSLISVDLSNFVSTNNLLYIGSSFKNCTSLKYVNLSNLDTKKVRHMDFMFYNCRSLTSLNLSNFDFSTVTWIESMFDGCEKLEYINLKNVVEKPEVNKLNHSNIFRGIPENAVICLIEEDTPILSSLIKNMKCPIIYCGDNWKQKQKQMLNCEIICDVDEPFLLNETQECVKYCDIDKILSGACITKYEGNKDNQVKLQDKFLDNILKKV